MWTNEQSIETAASPDAIWRLWSDVARWPEWNADIEHIEISRPFAAGSTITMTPIGQRPSTESRALTVTEAGSSIGWRSAARQPTRWAPS
jgi:hypothetical protein